MILYDYHFSSAGYRVRIALNLKGVAHERRSVMLLENDQRSPEHLARNPQGFVPALEVDGHVLTQSMAILEWLDARYPEPRLIPADPDARAVAMAQALAVACDIHPLNNLRVRRYLTGELGQSDEAALEWQRHWIAEGFDALEKMVAAADAGGPFLAGPAPGIADVCLVPQAFNARRIKMTLDRWPRLAAADAAANEMPAFADAHPSKVAPPAA